MRDVPASLGRYSVAELRGALVPPPEQTPADAFLAAREHPIDIPPPPQATTWTDEQLIAHARQSSPILGRLLDGDISGYPSKSEADAAATCSLARYTGGDADRIDRIIRGSQLYRPKWDERHYADAARL